MLVLTSLNRFPTVVFTHSNKNLHTVCICHSRICVFNDFSHLRTFEMLKEELFGAPNKSSLKQFTQRLCKCIMERANKKTIPKRNTHLPTNANDGGECGVYKLACVLI